MPILIKILANDQGSAVLDRIGAKAKQLESQSKKTGNSMMAMFGGMAFYSAASQVLGGLGALSKEMDTYQLNLRKIEQVGGVTGKGLGQVNEQMKKLALSTEYTHTQISAAGVVLSRMGINTAETLGSILPQAMNLATIAGEDLTLTAEGLGQIFTIFDVKSNETVTATNKIGQALNLTALDLKGYIEALQYSGAAAVSAKVSFDDVSAAVAYLSQKAVMGSRAGTTMKNILLAMVKPGSDVQKVMQANGLATNDLIGLFDLLSKKGAGADKIVKLFGMWATPGALGLQQGAKSLEELREKIKQASYDAAEHARVIRDENLPAWQQMLNAVTNLGLSFGEALGLKKGDAFKAIKEELIKLAGYVLDNKDKISDLGKELKFLGGILLELSSGGLKFLVENFNSLAIAFTGMWVSGKLAKIPAAMAGIQLSVSGLATAATAVEVAITSWLGPIGAAVLAMAGLNALMDYRERREKKIDEAKYQNLQSAKGTPRYIKQLMELSQSRKDMANAPVGSYFYQEAKNRHLKISGEMTSEYGYQPELAYANSVDLEIARQKFVGPKTPVGWTPAERITTKGGATSDTLSGLEDEESDRAAKLRADMASIFQSRRGRTAANRSNLTESETSYLADASWEKQKKLNEENLETERKWNEAMHDMDVEFAEKERQEKFMFADTMVNNAGMTADAIIAIDSRRHEAIMANLERERIAMDAKYDKDIAAAGDNTFKRTMVEQKYAQSKMALEKKMEAQKKEIAKNELARQKVDAVATYLTGLINLMSSGAKLGPWGSAAYVAAGVAMGVPLVMQLTAKNYREGSKGVIGGNGNATSDSEWARVSRGERVLSVNELSRLGGNERVQQMLDRHSTTSSRTVNVNIGTVYGSKQFVRELIPVLKMELSR
jgi:TP901 family phage tail tape measure protein